MNGQMQTLAIQKIVEHGPGVKSFYFEQTFEAKSGQFVNLWIPGVDEKPISVSNQQKGLTEISVKAYGPFTKELMKKKTGELLGLRGPFGHGFSLRENSLLIGGGIGIAPLRLLARELSEKERHFASLFGAASVNELIFKSDFEEQSQCYFYTDDGSFGKKGLVTEDLLKIIRDEKIEFIYAAGPEIMFVKLKEIIDPLNIPYEFCMERYMKCGIGICGQCVLDDSGIRLCVEGPVLNQDDLKDVTELGMVHRNASGRRIK